MGKRYEFLTDEGFAVQVDVVNEGTEDERMVQDWEVRVRAGGAYVIDGLQYAKPALTVLTSRDGRGQS